MMLHIKMYTVETWPCLCVPAVLVLYGQRTDGELPRWLHNPVSKPPVSVETPRALHSSFLGLSL